MIETTKLPHSLKIMKMIALVYYKLIISIQDFYSRFKYQLKSQNYKDRLNDQDYFLKSIFTFPIFKKYGKQDCFLFIKMTLLCFIFYSKVIFTFSLIVSFLIKVFFTFSLSFKLNNLVYGLKFVLSPWISTKFKTVTMAIVSLYNISKY